MKITIDTEKNTIELEESVNLQKFFNFCTKHFENWSDFTILHTKLVEHQWYPYTVPSQPIQPTQPGWDPANPWVVTGTGTTNFTKSTTNGQEN